MTAAGWNHSLALTGPLIHFFSILQNPLILAKNRSHSTYLLFQDQGVIYAWGNSDYGQLGLTVHNHDNNTNLQSVYSMAVSPVTSPRKFPMISNPSTDKIFPVPLNSLKSIRFIYVAAGLRHSAAITGSTSQTILFTP
jgi:alpha-tubulin suppressor-like RCC1 family protein